MRVMLVSKAMVVGPYQKKAEELARMPDVELLVVVPRVWQEPRGTVQVLERQYTEGYDLLEAPMYLNGKYHYHFYPTIGRIARRFRPDVFHIDEEPYNFATWHAMQAGKQVGAKMCFFTWQNIPKHYPPPFAQMERAVYAGVHAGIAGNQAGLEILRDKGFGKPAVVIPQFGFDPLIYQPPPPKPRPANHIPTIGYIGRLVEEKGVQVLLEAVALLRPHYRVEIIGTGYYRTELEVLASRLGIRDRIAFRNSVAALKVPEALNGFDVLVIPSLTRANWMEQFGRVIVEAMGCEVPVIGSDSGEIPNVIGDAGIIVPEGNAEQLALRLHELLEDREMRRDLAMRGRQRMLTQYTQRQVAQRHYQLYLSMLYGTVPHEMAPPLSPLPSVAAPPASQHAALSPTEEIPLPLSQSRPARTPRPVPEPAPATFRARPRPRPRPEPFALPDLPPAPSDDFSDDLLDDEAYLPQYGRGAARSFPTLRDAPEPDAEPFEDVAEETAEDAPAEAEPTIPDWWPRRDSSPTHKPQRSWWYDR